MITKKNKEEVKRLIEGAKKIGLVSHVYSDPDAFGCLLGMQEVLKNMGKEVVIFSGEKLVPLVKEYDPIAEYMPVSEFEKVDLLIILDLASIERVAAPKIILSLKDQKTIYIDHHHGERKNNLADLVDPEKTSASEICFELARDEKLPLNKKAVSYFYLGLYGDTGGFTFANTNEKVLSLAKEMLSYGPEFEEMAKKAFESDQKRKVDIFELCLSRAVKSIKYPLMISYLKLGDLNGEVIPEVSSQSANYIETTNSALGAVVLLEQPNRITKVSMRSNRVDFNVRELAEQFGGGGHDKAAGIITTKSISEMAKDLGVEFSESRQTA